MHLQHVAQDAPTLAYMEGSPVRCWLESGQPNWFGSTDLGLALGLSRTRMVHTLSDLSEEDKGVRLTHTLGGSQSVTVVNRSGVYQILGQMRDRVKRQRILKQMADMVVAHETGQAAPPALDQEKLLARLAQLEAKLDGIMLGLAAARRTSPKRRGERPARPQSPGYLSVNKWFETNVLMAVGEVPAMTAYKHYCDWAERQGQNPASVSIFGRALNVLGVSRRHTRDCRVYEGIQLVRILGSRL